MSSSRDFNAPFPTYRRNRSRSRDRFSRPAPSRTTSGNHARDRDRDRDRDRFHDRELRDRDLDTVRTTHTPQDQPAKMDPDRASAELAKALHQVTDLMTQKTQLSLKKDAELRAYHKRKQDYDCQISKPVLFPAVRDAFLGSQNHHKQTLAAIDKELAVLAPKEALAFDKYAQTLVRALPIDEIKIRQILEASKGELGLATTSSQSVQDEQLKKLEQRQAGFEETCKKHIASLTETQENQIASLKETQEKQIASLKETQEKQIALLRETQEKQASELAGYRETDTRRADSAKENEQLRAQVACLRSEVTSLTRRVGMVEPAQSSREYVDTQIGSLKAELSKLEEQAKLESTTKAEQDETSAIQGVTLRREIAALGDKCGELSRENEILRNTSASHTERIAALDTGVKKHEGLLADIDVEGLDDAMTDYTALKSQVAGQDLVIEDVKRSVAESLARIPEKMPADLPASFRAWSDRFMQVFGTKLDEHTKQIKSLQDFKSTTASNPQISTSLAPELETVASGVASAESRLTEVESKAIAVSSKLTALQETVAEVQKGMAGLQESIANLGSQADQRYGALETMVESLSSQWNNMSTTQMAQAILEQLSRLQPAQLVPEIRHFQERLSDVEKLIQEDGEQRKNLSMEVQSVCDNIAKAPKRGLGLEEKFPGHHDKRARIGGQNGVNGYGNGYVHP